MYIDKEYLENYKNLLFSDFEEVREERDNVLKKFVPIYFDKKNNESIKNVDNNKLANLNYNYKKPADVDSAIKNSNNSYTIKLFNGKCDNYKDENLEIKNIDSNDSKFFFNNKLANTSDFLIDLNSLFLNCGVKIIVSKNKNVDIKILNIVLEDGLTIFQKNLIICEEGSKVNLVEEYNNQNSSIHNIYNVFEVKKKSVLNQFVIQNNSKNHELYLSSYASCMKSSEYDQKVYNFSNGYVRNYHYSELVEENSTVSHIGFFFINSDNVSDNKTYVRHLAENCQSNQIYKGVLTDKSKANYFSNTYVDKIAQKTEGYQLSKGILLSKDSTYFSKPELRIFADDVKCSHGSTIGPIDENAIFYLRSRGINKNTAIKMIISSFINDDLENISNEQIKSIVNKNLNKFLDNIV